jgi:hypothetical protein
VKNALFWDVIPRDTFHRNVSSQQEPHVVTSQKTAFFGEENKFILCRAKERRLLGCFLGGKNDDCLLGYYTAWL